MLWGRVWLCETRHWVFTGIVGLHRPWVRRGTGRDQSVLVLKVWDIAWAWGVGLGEEGDRAGSYCSVVRVVGPCVVLEGEEGDRRGLQW